MKPTIRLAVVGSILCALASGGLSNAYSQIGSGGSAGGWWMGTRDESGGAGSLALGLELFLKIDADPSPERIYAVRKTASGEQFAYYFVVMHHSPQELKREFPFQLDVWDNIGTVEQSVGAGENICKISYRFEAPIKRSKTLRKESLVLGGKEANLDDGRVFVIDLKNDEICIDQVLDYSANTEKGWKASTDKILKDVIANISNKKLRTKRIVENKK